MTAKLNIVSSLAALALFFLPWIDIQCSNRSMATQSGFQIITGEGTVSKELDRTSRIGGRTRGSSSKDDSMGVSFLLGIALLAVAGALVVSILIFKGTSGIHPDAAGILCATALVIIVIQMAVGFPVMQKMSEDAPRDSGRQSANDPLGAAGAEMAASMFQVRTLPGFYLELLALGIPTLILGNSLLDKIKKQ